MTSNINDQLSALTGAKQTMLSWAKVIGSYAEIPEIFKKSCKAVLEDRHPFPHVVLVPSIGETRNMPAENLICEIDDIFHVWERVGSQVDSIAYPLKTISMFEEGRILLYSWFSVRGLTSDGVPSSSIVTFSSATARHVAPFINRMRPKPTDVGKADWQTELAKFDYLSSSNFKFMNYARESMMPGEKVICSILQPEIRKLIFTLFGHSFYRTGILAHLALLTDKEVIFIRDDENSTETKGKRYGGVWQYVPLRNIMASKLTESGDDLVTLSLALALGGQQLDKVFEASNKFALQNFQKELLQRIG